MLDEWEVRLCTIILSLLLKPNFSKSTLRNIIELSDKVKWGREYVM